MCVSVFYGCVPPEKTVFIFWVLFAMGVGVGRRGALCHSSSRRFGMRVVEQVAMGGVKDMLNCNAFITIKNTFQGDRTRSRAINRYE